jgi:hypothetical protein
MVSIWSPSVQFALLPLFVSTLLSRFALGNLRQNKTDQFLLQLEGHMANYQSRGTFGTTEQFSLYNVNDERWRDYLPDDMELSVDLCTPSQMQVALMTTWQLVLHDPDSAVVWLAKGAPRRWYSGNSSGESSSFAVRHAPTKYGLISFSIALVNTSTHNTFVPKVTPSLIVPTHFISFSIALVNTSTHNTFVPKVTPSLIVPTHFPPAVMCRPGAQFDLCCYAISFAFVDGQREVAFIYPRRTQMH